MDESLKKELAKATEILKKLGAREVFLFGSRASGKANKNSDMDLAITGLPPENFYKALARLIFDLDIPIHLIDLDEHSSFNDYMRAKEELISVG